MRRGSWSIRLIRSLSAIFPLSNPSALKPGERKLNISAADLPCNNVSISARVNGALKKSRSFIATFFCERNSFAFRQVVHLLQQKKSTVITIAPYFFPSSPSLSLRDTLCVSRQSHTHLFPILSFTCPTGESRKQYKQNRPLWV